jgi:hypothetical protein
MYFLVGPECHEYGLSALCIDGRGNGRSLRLNGLIAGFHSEVQGKAKKIVDKREL